MFRFFTLSFFFFVAYFFSACFPCHYPISDGYYNKLLNQLGQTYDGIVKLEDGKEESFQIYVEMDRSQYSSSLFGHFSIQPSFADECPAPDIAIRVTFTKNSDMLTGMNFLGKYVYTGSSAPTVFIFYQQDEQTRIFTHMFNISFDPQFKFMKGSYSREEKGQNLLVGTISSLSRVGANQSN
ncbi:MAG: hypothetical protein EP343_19495 [Deltaproteobacteria bacterium]|nr:MAG: hypothetical protein EP343_19495 [Deltaproteobacteria bacterium]